MADSELPESNETVTQLRRGGDAALAELFARNRERLRRMVHVRLDRRVAARIDPSDVLQEAFLEASRQLESYLATVPMSPFLWLRLLTAQRLMATHRRHLGVQKRDAKLEVSIRGGLPAANSESMSCYLAGRLTMPSQAVARLELQLQLREMLETLEPLDREIIALRHFEELTNAEAAQELDISQAAASKRYIRALERLKKTLTQIPGLSPD